MKTSGNIDRLLSRLRFRHLKLLEVLSATGSLRAAAAELNQTQPALSKALREIENTLGFAVFDRTRRGLKISSRGAIVVRGASLLIAELRHLYREAQHARSQAVLRLGAPPFVALSVVPRVLQKLSRHVPPILVLLSEQRVPQLHRLLLAGDLDALLTTYSSDLTPADGRQRLRYEKLLDSEVVVIAPATWRGPSSSSWHGLAGERWILPETASYIRKLVDEMFMREGVIAPEPVIESTNPLTSAELVAKGLGLAVVPAPTAVFVEKSKRIKRVKLRPPIPSAPVALIYRIEVQEHPRIKLLRQAQGLA